MTINLHGGPADAQNLMLRRAPALLRIVIGPGGNLDGLDQLTDEPAGDETVHVYKLRGKAGRVHLCYRGKNRGQSGWYATGEYDFLLTPIPIDARGVAWTLFAEELAAELFPQLLDPDVLACARDRLTYRAELRQRLAAAAGKDCLE